MNKEKIIQIENLNFSYNKTLALKDINLIVEKGDFLALIGSNGSGKSTLLKIILDLIHDKSDSIKLFNRKIDNFNEWEKISYVPQKAINFSANFPANVEEIVGMGLASIKKFPKFLRKTDKEKIIKALKQVGMEKYIKRRIGDLSGGQQQRVLIAKAIVTNPELLFLDEPTTGIDQEAQTQFYQLLHELNKKGITVVLVTHDVGRITKYVTKVALLNQSLRFYGSHGDFCSWDKSHKHEQKDHNLCLHH